MTTPATTPLQAHTPTPWHVVLDADSFANIVSPNADGTVELMVAECWGPQELQEANAAFIVHAVNSHAALVARVGELERAIADAVRRLDDWQFPNSMPIAEDIADDLRTALASTQTRDGGAM